MTVQPPATCTARFELGQRHDWVQGGGKRGSATRPTRLSSGDIWVVAPCRCFFSYVKKTHVPTHKLDVRVQKEGVGNL